LSWRPSCWTHPQIAGCTPNIGGRSVVVEVDQKLR
jgi:hypothetical protein